MFFVLLWCQNCINYTGQTIFIYTNILFHVNSIDKKHDIQVFLLFLPLDKRRTFRVEIMHRRKKSRTFLLWFKLCWNRKSLLKIGTFETLRWCLLSFNNNLNSIKPTYDFNPTRWKTLFCIPLKPAKQKRFNWKWRKLIKLFHSQMWSDEKVFISSSIFFYSQREIWITMILKHIIQKKFTPLYSKIHEKIRNNK